MKIQLDIERSFKLDMNAFAEFKELTGINPFGFTSVSDFVDPVVLRGLVYVGCKNAADGKFALSVNDVGDKLQFKDKEKVYAEFARAMGFDIETEYQDEDSKKK